jgi:Ca-activated chloride channel family protein
MMRTLPRMNDEETRSGAGEAGFGALTTTQGPLPLKALDVRVHLDGLLARTVHVQTFVNTHAEPLEATYIFPLPDRAAVTSFRLEVAGRVIEGELKERGQARQEYDAALRAGQRAAITEEERPGVFTMRVGNLPAGETAVVRLTLTGPLPYADGEATYRFPLVVAPRYIPGSPLPGPQVGAGTALDTDAVPDASRISPPVLLPGFPNPVRLGLVVEIPLSSLPLYDVRSSLHTVVEEETAVCRRLRVMPGERLDRDFILRYRIAEERITTHLALQPDSLPGANSGSPPSEEGTFLLTLVPPRTEPAAQRPRDLAFVLDRSGSMGGWKMVAARRAVARMVDTLTEHDRFTVLAFDDVIETPPGQPRQLIAASDGNRFRAVEYLAGVEARGGTEMAEPLRQGVAALNPEGGNPAAGQRRERVLVLITDGQVGNEDQILKQLAPSLRGIRVFTLGIDQAVNAAFLNRLADLGDGSCSLVESEDRLDAVMDQVHRHIGSPVLTSLKLEPAGLSVIPGSVVPSRLPDLFLGAPLLVSGRYRGAARGGLCVLGRQTNGAEWSARVEARREECPPAAAVWARGRLRELEDRYVVGAGDKAALEREIVGVSLRFGVLCRFTAFVAVDRTEAVNPGGVVHSIVQPVEQPAGWAEATAARAARTVCAATPSRAKAKFRKSMPPSAAPKAEACPAAPLSALDFLREEVGRCLSPGDDVVTMGKLPQTPRVKMVLTSAIEEARAMGHAEVDAEHLLLGLLHCEEGVAADMLRKIGLELEVVREEIRAEFTRRGVQAGTEVPTVAEMYSRFTDRARRVMQFANQEAQRFNHEYIDTEHILLGLLSEGSGLAGEILKRRADGTTDAAEPRRADWWK